MVQNYSNIQKKKKYLYIIANILINEKKNLKIICEINNREEANCNIFF